MRRFWFALLALTVTSLAACETGEPPAAPEVSGARSEATSESRGVGVVQSIDAANSKVTIAHEPIASLGWPAMTMGFAVSKPDLLDDLTTGQRVEFTLQGRDTSAVITSIRPAE